MRRSNARKVNPNSEENISMDSVRFPFRSSRAGFRSPRGKITNPRLRYCLYASFFVGLVLFCYILLHGNMNREGIRYRVVIDGGSTGTRIHVFKYGVRDGKLVLDFSQEGLVSMRVNPGLSSYAEEPERAGAAVAELMEFAKRNVPRGQWEEVEVRLMATAGMRLLKNEVQGRILNECRKVLKASGFKFDDHWATVISGSDEGLYAWVVANYALGTLGAEPSQTTGIIELGGASAQVTFVSNEPVPPEFSRKVKFRNVTYKLYSHSLLHFGQNVAFNLLKESLVSEGQDFAGESVQRGKLMDPCTPRGYIPQMEAGKLSPMSFIGNNRLVPSGNFSECRSASLKLLKKGQDKCSYKTCYIGSTFIPKLQGKFLATENFFHTSKFFGLGQKAFLSHLVVAGEQFCDKDWSKLTQKYDSLDEDDLLRYCFSSAYIVAMLHDSLGIALDDHRIEHANQVHNIPLDWALGAFVLQSAAELEADNPGWTFTLPADNSPPWLLLFVIFLALTLTSWLVLRWRKPKVKTIYDLEKGKYIVTRIGRYS